MGTRSLERFFKPETVAVIGASERKGSLGGAIMRNLTQGEFPGTILPVNSRGYDSVYGVTAFSKISQLKSNVPDLAIICTPADTVPRVIKQLHAIGVEVSFSIAM